MAGRVSRVPAIALALIAAAAVVAIALAPAVHRPPSFHDYADRRTWFGLAHAGDVLSNLPFVLAGVLGLARRRDAAVSRSLATLAWCAMIAIGIGSAAYHLDPRDATLAFDWLPIALTLSWVVALILADRVDRRVGLAAAVILPIGSAAAVLVWWWGGGTRGGDMRWYVGLQASLVAAVALVPLVLPRGRLPRAHLLAGVACFAAARLAGAHDRALLDAIAVSGHSLKHLLAGGAAALVTAAIVTRRSGT